MYSRILQPEVWHFSRRARDSSAVVAERLALRVRAGGGNDMSFTRLRNVLKDPNKSEEEQLNAWLSGFDSTKLGRDYIKKLMDTAKRNMTLKENISFYVSKIKPLIPHASIEQKEKFYNLLKEAKNTLEKEITLSEGKDYLDEK